MVCVCVLAAGGLWNLALRFSLCLGQFQVGLKEGIQECRVEAGTSGFLSNSDSDRSVPAALGQESQAMSFLRNGTPLASRVVHGVSGPLSNCVWNLQVFPDDEKAPRNI